MKMKANLKLLPNQHEEEKLIFYVEMFAKLDNSPAFCPILALAVSFCGFCNNFKICPYHSVPFWSSDEWKMIELGMMTMVAAKKDIGQ